MRRGSQLDPPNRFLPVHAEPDPEHFAFDEDFERDRIERPVVYLDDAARSLVTENDSPDVPFRFSANPYRGCLHGCPYCYARNSHEYLGLGAGLHFETRIHVKREAPALFREFLARDAWRPEPIVFSGVTDCYQPAERRFRLTRGCLEVAAACGQPVSIITKNALVLRDLDVLRDLASRRLVHAHVSITTFDAALARDMEPAASTPVARLRAVEQLAAAGIPVRAMIAPIVPGLTDSEIPALLEAVRNAGAHDARYVLLRLPLTVEPVFFEWLHRTRPECAAKVESQIRQTHAGKTNLAEWGTRMRGTGPIAEQIRSLFAVFHARMAFPGLPPLDTQSFRPPVPRSGQLRLF